MLYPGSYIRIYKRILSAVLVFCFALMQSSYASVVPAPGTLPSTKHSLQEIVSDPSKLQVPLEYCSVQEFYRGTSDRLIIHIQDPHANYGGQKNLSETLNQLMNQYAIPNVLVEGSSKEATLSDARQVLSRKDLDKVANKLLYYGVISGEEYLNLTSEHEMRLLGIENEALYRENLVAYQALIHVREKALPYTYVLKQSVRHLKNALYPRDILNFESIDASNFTETISTLLSLANTNKIKTADYPEIQKFKDIQRQEADINFEQLNQEIARLIQLLNYKGSETLSQQSQATQLIWIHQLMDLAQKRSLPIPVHSQLAKYQLYLTTFNQMNLTELIQETDGLKQSVYEKLLPTEDLKKIHAIDRYLDLLDKGYKVQINSSDFKTFIANKEDFATRSMVAFINLKMAELGHYGEMVVFDPILDDSTVWIERFYEIVQKRDLAFLENTIRIFDESPQKVNFLISGGYHTEHLNALMRGENISYITLSPKVVNETKHADYEKLLFAGISAQDTNLKVSSAVRQLASRFGGQGRFQMLQKAGARLGSDSQKVIEAITHDNTALEPETRKDAKKIRPDIETVDGARLSSSAGSKRIYSFDAPQGELNAGYWGLLQEEDRKNILQLLSQNAGNIQDTRSLVYDLIHPFEWQRISIQTVQIKGFYVDQREEVKTHAGRGFAAFNLFGADDSAPDGGMLAEHAEREYFFLKQFLEGFSADDAVFVKLPLGWGTFPEMTHQGKKLGFILMGVPHFMERRMKSEDIVSGQVYQGMKLTGSGLGFLHNKGIGHGFYHPGNMSYNLIETPSSTVPANLSGIHDLDNAFNLELKAEEHQIQVYLIALTDLFSSLFKLKEFTVNINKTIVKDPISIDYIFSAFLEGYFNHISNRDEKVSVIQSVFDIFNDFNDHLAKRIPENQRGMVVDNGLLPLFLEFLQTGNFSEKIDATIFSKTQPESKSGARLSGLPSELINRAKDIKRPAMADDFVDLIKLLNLPKGSKVASVGSGIPGNIFGGVASGSTKTLSGAFWEYAAWLSGLDLTIFEPTQSIQNKWKVIQKHVSTAEFFGEISVNESGIFETSESPDAYYDAIISMSVLTSNAISAEDKQAIIRKKLDSLKTDGYLIMGWYDRHDRAEEDKNENQMMDDFTSVLMDEAGFRNKQLVPIMIGVENTGLYLHHKFIIYQLQAGARLADERAIRTNELNDFVQLLNQHQVDVDADDVHAAIKIGLDEATAQLWFDALAPSKSFHFPERFFSHPNTLKHWIMASLDSLPGFKIARQWKNWKEASDIYRQHVLNYPHFRDKKGSPQTHFFENESGVILTRMMQKDYMDYLKQIQTPSSQSMAKLIQFVLPEIIGEYPLLLLSEVERGTEDSRKFISESLLKSAFESEDADAVQRLLNEYGSEKSGITVIPVNRKARQYPRVHFFQNSSGKDIHLHHPEKVAEPLKVWFEKKAGVLFVVVREQTSGIFLYRAKYDKDLGRFVFGAEYAMRWFEGAEGYPVLNDPILIERQEGNPAHNYYFGTTSGGKTINLGRDTDTRTEGVSQDSSLSVLVVRPRKDGTTKRLYAYLDFNQKNSELAIGRWTWSQKENRFDVDYFLPFGTGAWFDSFITKGMPNPQQRYYKRLDLNSHGEGHVFALLKLRIGDVYRGRIETMPAQVAMVSSDENHRVDVYSSSSSTPDRGLWKTKGNSRYITSRFYDGKEKLFVRPWQELSRRLESRINDPKQELNPSGILMQAPSYGRTRLAVIQGHSVELEYDLTTNEYLWIQPTIMNIGKSQHVGVQVFLLDKNWNPKFHIRDGYWDDASSSWVWMNDNHAEQLDKKVQRIILTQLTELEYRSADQSEILNGNEDEGQIQPSGIVKPEEYDPFIRSAVRQLRENYNQDLYLIISESDVQNTALGLARLESNELDGSILSERISVNSILLEEVGSLVADSMIRQFWNYVGQAQFEPEEAEVLIESIRAYVIQRQLNTLLLKPIMNYLADSEKKGEDEPDISSPGARLSDDTNRDDEGYPMMRADDFEYTKNRTLANVSNDLRDQNSSYDGATRSTGDAFAKFRSPEQRNNAKPSPNNFSERDGTFSLSEDLNEGTENGVNLALVKELKAYENKEQALILGARMAQPMNVIAELMIVLTHLDFMNESQLGLPLGDVYGEFIEVRNKIKGKLIMLLEDLNAINFVKSTEQEELDLTKLLADNFSLSKKDIVKDLLRRFLDLRLLLEQEAVDEDGYLLGDGDYSEDIQIQSDLDDLFIVEIPRAFTKLSQVSTHQDMLSHLELKIKQIMQHYFELREYPIQSEQVIGGVLQTMLLPFNSYIADFMRDEAPVAAQDHLLELQEYLRDAYALLKVHASGFEERFLIGSRLASVEVYTNEPLTPEGSASWRKGDRVRMRDSNGEVQEHVYTIARIDEHSTVYFEGQSDGFAIPLEVLDKQFIRIDGARLSDAEDLHALFRAGERVEWERAVGILEQLSREILPDEALPAFGEFLKEARVNPRAGDESGSKNSRYLWVMVYPVLKNHIHPNEWTEGKDIVEILQAETQALQTPLVRKTDRKDPEILKVILDGITAYDQDSTIKIFPANLKRPEGIQKELRGAYTAVAYHRAILLRTWRQAISRAGFDPDEFQSSKGKSIALSRQKRAELPMRVSADPIMENGKVIRYTRPAEETPIYSQGIIERFKQDDAQTVVFEDVVLRIEADGAGIFSLGEEYATIPPGEGASDRVTVVVDAVTGRPQQAFDSLGNSIYGVGRQQLIYLSSSETYKEDIRQLVSGKNLPLYKAVFAVTRPLMGQSEIQNAGTVLIANVPLYQNASEEDGFLPLFHFWKLGFPVNLDAKGLTSPKVIVTMDAHNQMPQEAYFGPEVTQVYPHPKHYRIRLLNHGKEVLTTDQAPLFRAAGKSVTHLLPDWDSLDSVDRVEVENLHLITSQQEGRQAKRRRVHFLNRTYQIGHLASSVKDPVISGTFRKIALPRKIKNKSEPLIIWSAEQLKDVTGRVIYPRESQTRIFLNTNENTPEDQKILYQAGHQFGQEFWDREEIQLAQSIEFNGVWIYRIGQSRIISFKGKEIYLKFPKGYEGLTGRVSVFAAAKDDVPQKVIDLATGDQVYPVYKKRSIPKVRLSQEESSSLTLRKQFQALSDVDLQVEFVNRHSSSVESFKEIGLSMKQSKKLLLDYYRDYFDQDEPIAMGLLEKLAGLIYQYSRDYHPLAWQLLHESIEAALDANPDAIKSDFQKRITTVTGMFSRVASDASASGGRLAGTQEDSVMGTVQIQDRTALIEKRGNGEAVQQSFTYLPKGGGTSPVLSKVTLVETNTSESNLDQTLFVYGIPIDYDTSEDHGIRGIYIGSQFRGQGLMRPLLNTYFASFPEVRRVHANMLNPFLRMFLEQHYGFAPATEDVPNAYLVLLNEDNRSLPEVRSILTESESDDPQYLIYFTDSEQKDIFESEAPEEMKPMYAVISDQEVFEKIQSLDTIQTIGYHAGQELIVTDQEQFDQAMTLYPVSIKNQPLSEFTESHILGSQSENHQGLHIKPAETLMMFAVTLEQELGISLLIQNATTEGSDWIALSDATDDFGYQNTLLQVTEGVFEPGVRIDIQLYGNAPESTYQEVTRLFRSLLEDVSQLETGGTREDFKSKYLDPIRLLSPKRADVDSSDVGARLSEDMSAELKAHSETKIPPDTFEYLMNRTLTNVSGSSIYQDNSSYDGVFFSRFFRIEGGSETPISDLIKEVIQFKGRAVIVDIGSGRQSALIQAKQIYRDSVRTIAVDVKNHLDELAESYFGFLSKSLKHPFAESQKPEFVLGSMETVQLPERPDIVLSVFSMPYAENPLLGFENLFNQLKPDGIFAGVYFSTQFKNFDPNGRGESQKDDWLQMVLNRLEDEGLVEGNIRPGGFIIRKKVDRKININLIRDESRRKLQRGLDGQVHGDYQLKHPNQPIVTFENESGIRSDLGARLTEEGEENQIRQAQERVTSEFELLLNSSLPAQITSPSALDMDRIALASVSLRDISYMGSSADEEGYVEFKGDRITYPDGSVVRVNTDPERLAKLRLELKSKRVVEQAFTGNSFESKLKTSLARFRQGLRVLGRLFEVRVQKFQLISDVSGFTDSMDANLKLLYELNQEERFKPFYNQVFVGDSAEILALQTYRQSLTQIKDVDPNYLEFLNRIQIVPLEQVIQEYTQDVDSEKQRLVFAGQVETFQAHYEANASFKSLVDDQALSIVPVQKAKPGELLDALNQFVSAAILAQWSRLSDGDKPIFISDVENYFSQTYRMSAGISEVDALAYASEQKSDWYQKISLPTLGQFIARAFEQFKVRLQSVAVSA